MKKFSFLSCFSHSWSKLYKLCDIVHTDTTTKFDKTDSKQSDAKPVLLSKYDPVTFAKLIFAFCWFKKIKFHRRTFFRFRALKL